MRGVESQSLAGLPTSTLRVVCCLEDVKREREPIEVLTRPAALQLTSFNTFNVTIPRGALQTSPSLTRSADAFVHTACRFMEFPRLLVSRLGAPSVSMTL